MALVDDDAGPELEARDGLLQPGDLLLLGDVELLLAQQRHLARDGIGGVVARPERDLPMLKLGDLANRLVEQIAVVRDDHHGAGELAHEAFELLAVRQVEVGLRLVEQQQFWTLEHAARERDELALAAAERAHG